jgi:hypothetical protein
MLAHETGQANGVDSVGRRDRAGTNGTVVRIAARRDATHAAPPLLLPLLNKSLTLTSFSSNCVPGTTRFQLLARLPDVPLYETQFQCISAEN